MSTVPCAGKQHGHCIDGNPFKAYSRHHHGFAWLNMWQVDSLPQEVYGIPFFDLTPLVCQVPAFLVSRKMSHVWNSLEVHATQGLLELTKDPDSIGRKSPRSGKQILTQRQICWIFLFFSFSGHLFFFFFGATPVAPLDLTASELRSLDGGF